MSTVFTYKNTKTNRSAVVTDYETIETTLLNNYEYSGNTRCCDKADPANIALILTDVYESLYENSQPFKLHVKTLSKNKATPGCITIQEFLTAYLIKDNKYNFPTQFPTLYKLLTSFSEIFIYKNVDDYSDDFEDDDDDD